jgi:hypothetical protein
MDAASTQWTAARLPALERRNRSATGPTTVHPLHGAVMTHRASHDEGHWTVIMSLPDQPDGYPLAFALWDGSQGDRPSRRLPVRSSDA